MYRKPESMPEVIFKYNEFVGVWHQIGLTIGRTPSGSDTVRKNARLHHLVELGLPHEGRYPFLVMARLGGRLLRVTTSPLRRHPLDLDRNWPFFASFLALVTERV